MLTEDQKLEINLKNDIDRLSKQRDVLEEMVKKLAEQHDMYYAKRSEAAQEYEKIKISIGEADKKHLERRRELDQYKAELADREQKIKILNEKLSDDKTQFHLEKKHYEGVAENLSKREGDIASRLITVEKKEKDLAEKEDSFYVREKRTTMDLEEKAESLKAVEAELRNLQTAAGIAKTEADSDKEAYSKKFAELVAKESQLEAKIEAERKRIKDDLSARDESLRKRELEIVRKEREIDSRSQGVNLMKENIEIAEARTRKKRKVEK